MGLCAEEHALYRACGLGCQNTLQPHMLPSPATHRERERERERAGRVSQAFPFQYPTLAYYLEGSRNVFGGDFEVVGYYGLWELGGGQ